MHTFNYFSYSSLANYINILFYNVFSLTAKPFLAFIEVFSKKHEFNLKLLGKPWKVAVMI
jgi:hypothetical protein